MRQLHSFAKTWVLALVLLVMAGGGALLAGPAGSSPQGTPHALPGPVLFTQQDVVTVLNPPPPFGTGTGVRIGTVHGKINGTITTNLQFLPATFPNFVADDTAVLVDIDGDEIKFHVVSNGFFLVPLDPLVNSFGGPFTATYTVVSATGKFAGLVGRMFNARGIGSSAAAPSPVPGVVLAQVFGVLAP